MATYYTLLTKIGQASIANAVALNTNVNLTFMAVGDGNGNPTTPNENQTALVREKYRAGINQLTIDENNPNYLIAEMIIPTTVGGWSINEVGVFDEHGQLIAVANFPATYKPELVEGSGRDLIVRIIIQVSNVSVVTLKVDPAVILASQAWVAANYVKKVTVAGGTTGQVLVKKSNANEDFIWKDPTAAVNVIVDSETEEQTLATNQTVVDLATVTTRAVAIFVEGVRLYPVTHYTINNNTRLTLKTSYPGGSKLLAVQNEPISSIGMASTVQSGFTQLSSAIDSDSESLAATPKAVKSVSPGRLLNIQYLTATGTYTKTPGTNKAKVRGVGGGGAGGGVGNSAADSVRSGGGGGGGTYGEIWLTTVPATVPFTVGAGGVGVTGSGNNGGNSTFGSYLTLPGGSGGELGINVMGAARTSGGGGGGLAATGGSLSIRGQDGDDSFAVSSQTVVAGSGGNSQLGSGASQFIATNSTGSAFSYPGKQGSGYGAGGGGATCGLGGSASSGGNGRPGIFIVEEYA